MRKFFLPLFFLAASVAAQPGHGPISGGSGGASGPATELQSPVVIEGTADAFEGNFTFADPTADWTWAWGAAGDLVGAGSFSIDNLKLDGNTISSTDTNGNISLAPNGSGQVLFNSGTAAVPSFRIGSSSKGIYYDPNSPAGIAFTDSTATMKIVQGEAILVGNGLLSWGNQLNDFASSTADISLRRAATGVLKVDSGSGTQKWLFQAGHRALAADFTSTSATPADLTGLTETLLTGRKYYFRLALRFSDSTAADGARFDFDGGTATATDFGVNCQVYDTALLLSQDTTALATDIVASTTTGASSIKCDGSFIVNAAGTFIPRAGQEAASGGTLTIETGSYLDITDASFN